MVAPKTNNVTALQTPLSRCMRTKLMLSMFLWKECAQKIKYAVIQAVKFLQNKVQFHFLCTATYTLVAAAATMKLAL